MDLAKKIKGKLPHIFGSDAGTEDGNADESETTAAGQESAAEESGGDIGENETPAGFVHEAALGRHLKAGNHPGIRAAIHGIMKSGKGNLE